MSNDNQRPVYGYMCYTDFLHEAGEDGARSVKVYRSVKELKQDYPCVEECGWIKVELKPISLGDRDE